MRFLHSVRSQVTKALLMATVFCALAGCGQPSPAPLSTRGQALEPLPTTLSDALQGVYDVCWGYGPCSPIGELEIRGNQYQFRPREGADVDEARKRLSFVLHPEGTYTTSYKASYSPELAFDDVKTQDKTLLRLVFEGSDLEGMRAFEIRNDPRNQRFFLHGTIGEVQMWGVTQSWPKP